MFHRENKMNSILLLIISKRKNTIKIVFLKNNYHKYTNIFICVFVIIGNITTIITSTEKVRNKKYEIRI